MLNPNFRDMLSALCDNEAEFMVVGAYALAFMVTPRATGDVDIWIRPSPENAERVWRTLVDFGASLEGISPHDLTAWTSSPDQSCAAPH